MVQIKNPIKTIGSLNTKFIGALSGSKAIKVLSQLVNDELAVYGAFVNYQLSAVIYVKDGELEQVVSDEPKVAKKLVTEAIDKNVITRIAGDGIKLITQYKYLSPKMVNHSETGVEILN